MSDKTSIQKSILSNGVRVLTENLPWLKSASLGLWVNHGSRFENQKESGLAHFIEHMVFKGTTNRNCLEITREIEKTGGMINAFTSRESCCYQSQCLTEDLATAVDVITDVVIRPTFDEKELDQERKVIIQEILMTEDEPEDYLEEKWFAGAFPDQSMGRSILGTEQTLNAMTRDDLVRYHSENYGDENLLLAVVGNIDHQKVCEFLENSFARGTTRASSGGKKNCAKQKNSDGNKNNRAGQEGSGQQENSSLIPFLKNYEAASFKNGFQFIDKDLEQVLFLSSFKTTGYGDDARFTASVLNTHLGGGMSSKLFQEIREKRGLAYSVGSSFTTYNDIGLFDFYLGTDVKKLAESKKVLAEIKNELSTKGITQKEMDDAKKMLRGALLIVEDEPDERMSTLALSDLRFGRNITLEEVLEKVDAVKLEDINSYCQKLFVDANSHQALMGKIEDKELQTAFWI